MFLTAGAERYPPFFYGVGLVRIMERETKPSVMWMETGKTAAPATGMMVAAPAAAAAEKVEEKIEFGIILKEVASGRVWRRRPDQRCSGPLPVSGQSLAGSAVL